MRESNAEMNQEKGPSGKPEAGVRPGAPEHRPKAAEHQEKKENKGQAASVHGAEIHRMFLCTVKVLP